MPVEDHSAALLQGLESDDLHCGFLGSSPWAITGA